MRFLTITSLVALTHITISGVMFTLGLAGIGAMTPSEAQYAHKAWENLIVWNCAPIEMNQYLENHVYGSSARKPYDSD